MQQCWHWSANDRPTFQEIHHGLENMFQESSINEGLPFYLPAYQIDWNNFLTGGLFPIKLVRLIRSRAAAAG